MKTAVFSLVLLIYAWVGSTGVAYGLTCSDPNVGYSFDVPDDWVRIPQDAVDAMQHQLTAGQAKAQFAYVAAYQPKGNFLNFQYPYLLVQVTPYTGISEMDSVSESDLKKRVQGLSNQNADDLLKSAGPVVKLITSSFRPGEATYFTDPPGMQYKFQLGLLLVGNVRGVMHELLAKEHLVTVNLYAKEGQWDQFAPVFDGIIGSFHLQPEKQVTLRTGGILTSAFYGGIIGGAAGVLGYWLKRKKADAATPPA